MGLTPFDRMLDSTLYVAGSSAAREGHPMAVARHEAGQPWTCYPAARPDPPGYRRIVVIEPHQHTEEGRMGLAKRVYTALGQGDSVSVTVLRALGRGPKGQPLDRPRPEGDIDEAIASHALAFGDGPAIPSAIQAPDPDLQRTVRDEAGQITTVIDRGGTPLVPGDGEFVERPDGTVDLVLAADQVPPLEAGGPPPPLCTACGGTAPPCIALCAKMLQPALGRWKYIGPPGSRIAIVGGRSLVVPPDSPAGLAPAPPAEPPPTLEPVAPPPLPATPADPPGPPQGEPTTPIGPYGPILPARAPRRGRNAPAPGQRSLFD